MRDSGLETTDRGFQRGALWFLLLLFVFGSSLTVAQSVRSLVREGNSWYADRKFDEAEVNYRKALEKEPELVQGRFNLGNSRYKQGKADEAVKEFEAAAAKAEMKETRAHALYNIGNAHLKGEKYQEAVRSYIESLKLAPTDQDTKYNLSYALAKLKEQQQQQQQNKNDKNKDNKQNQQQDKQDQDKQDQQKQQQDRQQQDQQQQEQQQRQQQAQQEKQMSKAEAQRILDVLKDNEKDVQKKLRVRPAQRAKVEKDW